MGRRCGEGEPGPAGAAGRGCCSDEADTPVPPPRLHRDESPDRRGGKKGSRQPGGLGKGETRLSERKEGRGKVYPHPAAAFCSRLGRSASFSRGCEFFLQSRGGCFNFKVENRTRRFFSAGAGREWDAEEGEHPTGGCSRPPGCGGDRLVLGRGWDRISGCLYVLLRGIWGAVVLSLGRKEIVHTLTPSTLFEFWSL